MIWKMIRIRNKWFRIHETMFRRPANLTSRSLEWTPSLSVPSSDGSTVPLHLVGTFFQIYTVEFIGYFTGRIADFVHFCHHKKDMKQPIWKLENTHTERRLKKLRERNGKQLALRKNSHVLFWRYITVLLYGFASRSGTPERKHLATKSSLERFWFWKRSLRLMKGLRKDRTSALVSFWQQLQWLRKVKEWLSCWIMRHIDDAWSEGGLKWILSIPFVLLTRFQLFSFLSNWSTVEDRVVVPVI